VRRRAGRYQSQERIGRGYTIPRWDAERVAEIVNEVAAMPGAALHLSQVPLIIEMTHEQLAAYASEAQT
jgi:hypothetical protein